MMKQHNISNVYIITRKTTNKIVLRGLVDGIQKTRSTKYDNIKINQTFVETNKLKIFAEIINNKKKSLKEDYTLLSYASKMIKESGFVSKGEITEHLSRLNKYIAPYFPNMIVSDISIENVESWQKSLYEDPSISNDRLSRSFNTFKMIMHYASGRLKFDDPFPYVNKIRKETVKKADELVDYYTFDEVKRMLKYCDDPELLLYINLAVFTGLRENEILALRNNSISFENEEIHVKEAIKRGKIGAPKVMKQRKVPLLKPLKQFLLSIDFFGYKKGSGFDFIFTSPRKKATANKAMALFESHYYDAEPMRRKFKLLLKKEEVNIKWIGMYELKHSFATFLVEAGVPVTAISKILGHSTIEMTIKHYIKPRLVNQSDIEKAENYFNDII